MGPATGSLCHFSRWKGRAKGAAKVAEIMSCVRKLCGVIKSNERLEIGWAKKYSGFSIQYFAQTSARRNDYIWKIFGGSAKSFHSNSNERQLHATCDLKLHINLA